MKKFLLLFLLVIPTFLFAQHHEDVVYLRNGSVIRGIIIEQVPNESIRIETRDGNILFFRIDEIERFRREVATDTRRSRSSQIARQSNFNKPRGYMGMVEIDGGLGVGGWATDRLSLSVINGYRIAPQFAIGLGVGLEIFWLDTDWGAYADFRLPVFLHLRSDFIENRVSPFAAFNIGYNLNLWGGNLEGLILEPVVGIGFNVGRRSRMTAGVSFAVNRIHYRIWTDGRSYRGTAWGNALKLKTGISW